MDKDGLERVCRNAGMTPEKRQSFGDYDLYVADGFSSIPGIVYRRFGVEPDDFPNGAYATLWWIGQGEKLLVGLPCLFDAFHDLNLPADTRKSARINRALKDAEEFVTKLERERHAVH